MSRQGWVLLGLLAGGCEGPTAPPLVSAQFPPGTGHVNVQAEPQPLGSLPPGAANYSSAPGATQPQYLTRTFRVP